MAAVVDTGQRGGALTADALMEPWFAALKPYLGEVRLFDAHTHLGCADPDGSCFGAAELRAALGVVDARAVVFPLAEPGGYSAANDRMLAAAELSYGRLVPFCRVDPRDGGLHEAQRAVSLGAAGIKLHPRAERFRLGDAEVREILAFADERRLPIIVHAGRGIPSLGRDALDLAREYPSAPIILAHASITDLAWIWREAAGQRNLFFDTAWWNTADQLALFSLIPPGQILFASDTPYGRTVAAAAVVLRAALAAGLTREQIASVAGGQLERLLAGAEPLDVGPAPMTTAPASGSAARARAHAARRGDRAPDGRLPRGRVPGARTLRLRAAVRPSRRRCRGVGARPARPPRGLRGERPAPARSAPARRPHDLRRRGARRGSRCCRDACPPPPSPHSSRPIRSTPRRRRSTSFARTEFARLDAGGHVYLDYTGGGLFARVAAARARRGCWRARCSATRTRSTRRRRRAPSSSSAPARTSSSSSTPRRTSTSRSSRRTRPARCAWSARPIRSTRATASC